MLNRVKPTDADLIAPGVEYAYIYVTMDAEPGILDADITYFDFQDSKTDYHNRITGVQLQDLIASLTDEGWMVMHTEAGRDQEEHYLQRRKARPLTPTATQSFFAAAPVEEAPPAETDAASGQVRPGDRHLMQASMEYCYIYCAISLTTFTAEVNITIFDVEKTRTETRSVGQGEIRGIVAGYMNAGWTKTHQENGSGFEAYYLRRQKL